MHTPEHHHWRGIMLRENIFWCWWWWWRCCCCWTSIAKFRSVYLFFDLLTRVTPMNDSGNLFKSQFITCWNYHSEKKDDSTPDIYTIYFVHIFLIADEWDKKQCGGVLFWWGEISICCRFCSEKFWLWTNFLGNVKWKLKLYTNIFFCMWFMKEQHGFNEIFIERWVPLVILAIETAKKNDGKWKIHVAFKVCFC